MKLDRNGPYVVLYKDAKIVLVCRTRWSPELKISLNDIFSSTAGQILMKLKRNDPWVILNRNCLNRSGLLDKMAARAKNRISPEAFNRF